MGQWQAQTYPGFSFQNYTGLNNRRWLNAPRETHNLQANVTKEQGSHSLKFGWITELARLNNTDFNTTKLLNGGIATGGVTFQVGANAGQTINVTVGTASAAALTVDSSAISVGSASLASTTIDNIDKAIAQVSNERSKLGASINRLQHTITNLGVQSENINSAKSRIMDLDMAKEVVNMSKAQILSQSATSMLSQANQSSQGVPSLLRG